MARTEKPYRVYRGGRSKGKVPLQRKVERTPRRDGGGARERYPGPGARPSRRRWGWGRRIGVAVVLVLLLLVVWGVASWFAVSSGVKAANKRVTPQTRAALTSQDGLLLSHPTDILVLGTDHAQTDQRAALEHSDSIMLVRTDPGRHRVVYLSIPRDLRVAIPGHGEDKINAAFQMGGPALAIKAVEKFTGLPVNHVAVVDFGNFEQLIDRLGGVDVNVPAPIVSNRFDCPYSTQARCQRWPGWRFPKGEQHMDGHRALIYSRIRENRLNPAESDLTRGERQQAVLQALSAKLTSVTLLAKLPFVGDDLLKPLATDLTTGQFLQLAWVKFRAPAGRALHCRLGGSASQVGGQSVIVSTQENFAVVHMVTGETAPQPPPPGSGPFGPGCVIGGAHFR